MSNNTNSDSFAETMELSQELFIACGAGLVRAASLLIEEGANVNFTTPKRIDSWTCLHEAVWHGYPAIVELLIKKGAVVKATTTSDGQTPFDVAIEKKNKEIIYLLMRYE